MKLSRPTEKLTLVLSITLTLVGAPNAADHRYRIIYRFRAGRDGWSPIGAVAAAKNGDLYGATANGGGYSGGTIYKLTAPTTRSGRWTKTLLHTFRSGDGGYAGSVVIGAGGTLYGFAFGPQTCGFIWQLTPPVSGDEVWKYASLYTFNGTSDGCGLQGNPVFDAEGNLYGATESGGNVGCDHNGYGCGTVFELRRPPRQGGKWHFKVLYAFIDESGEAQQPDAGITFSRRGNLFGAADGGIYEYGAIYRITWPARTKTLLYSFDPYSDGLYVPFGPMTFDKRRRQHLYGTAAFGGGFGCGGVFELSPPAREGKDWTYAMLYAFVGGKDGCNGGGYGDGNLVLDRGGNLYGTTPDGGDTQQGTVFRLSPSTNSGRQWTETILHSFTDKNGDGGLPGFVTWGKWGNLYGVTWEGGGKGCYGEFGCGTVFEVRP
jgi:uncharacterized repeat protein (TIGR03803 family)